MTAYSTVEIKNTEEEEFNLEDLNKKSRDLSTEFFKRTKFPYSKKSNTIVSSRYFKCLINGWRLTPDRVLLFDLTHQTYTSDCSYEYDGLIYLNGMVRVLWSATDENLINIDLSPYRIYDEFRKRFVNDIDKNGENELRTFWNTYKKNKVQLI